ncbi:MAG: metallophosphoesterase [Chthoniobacterales bacterium]
MTSIEERLLELLDDCQPRQLIIAGDLVHDQTSAAAAATRLARLRERCAVIVLAGNHDRDAGRMIDFLPRWETPGFVFHHGDCAALEPERIQIIGHHHPAGTLSDGAGLRLKLPAFVQQDRCWILPAFSPWAGGVAWPRRFLRRDGN